MRKLLLLLFLASCKMQVESTSLNEIQDTVNNITYVKDQRTGVCFAFAYVTQGGGASGLAFTYVPCPTIEPYIVKEKLEK